MLQRLRMLTATLLAVLVLTSLAFSAPVKIGSITLNESNFEKFGALYFPFHFKIPAPMLFVLCDVGVSSAGGCLNNLVSDVVCVNNNQVGEGVAAMISDPEKNLSIGNIPPDFPCPVTSPTKFFKETGKAQLLSGKGIPTILPTGAPGPVINVYATSDLDPVTSTTSDTLLISTQ